MKNLVLLFSLCAIGMSLQAQNSEKMMDELIGEWKLDMSPQDPNDSDFAMMRIDKLTKNGFTGTFYREGVKIQEGRINTQRDVVYGALVSADNSSSYNTSFYLMDGKLYGSTHAIERDFLSVWVATKVGN